jgi:hypothetical protein
MHVYIDVYVYVSTTIAIAIFFISTLEHPMYVFNNLPFALTIFWT